MEKKVLILQEGDELLAIGRRIARLQRFMDTAKRVEEEINRLKVKGAEIMKNGGFTHTKHPEFTGYLMTHYAGINYEAVVRDIPNFWKKYSGRKLAMKYPRMMIFPKKKK